MIYIRFNNMSNFRNYFTFTKIIEQFSNIPMDFKFASNI